MLVSTGVYSKYDVQYIHIRVWPMFLFICLWQLTTDVFGWLVPLHICSTVLVLGGLGRFGCTTCIKYGNGKYMCVSCVWPPDLTTSVVKRKWARNACTNFSARESMLTYIVVFLLHVLSTYVPYMRVSYFLPSDNARGKNISMVNVWVAKAIDVLVWTAHTCAIYGK